jgi:hypothetical protein
MPIPRLKPKLMAIGDSLPQGCRNLSIKASYCLQSWPARLAQTQGWFFASPDHHNPVLFDLEAEVRRLDPIFLSPANLAFAGLPGRILGNFERWQKRPGGSASECFDNLSVAGFQVHDLYSCTSARSDAFIKRVAAGGPVAVLNPNTLGDLHLAINSRFVLNPQEKSAYAGFSPLDWIEHREPETLLVQIGHNHGLFGFGFSAKDQNSITQGDYEGRDYWQQWDEVARRLANLPSSVQRILVVLLPKVGAVAELHPTSKQRVNGYAPAYEPRLLPVPHTLTGLRVAEVDAEIRRTNVRIESLVRSAASIAGTEARLIFLDAYAAIDSLDFKNSLKPSSRLKIDNGVLLDNCYLDGRPALPNPFRGELIAGGYMSIDGMHASGVGYADIASRALTALKLPQTPADRKKLLRQAFSEDTLLSNYPIELDGLVRLAAIARTLMRANHFFPKITASLEDDTHMAFSLPILASAFCR